MSRTLTIADFEAAVGEPLTNFHHQCHNASIRLVRSGVLGEARVARGSCPGVGGQHSWVVLGTDCWDRDATIVDPTLWSYGDGVPAIYCGPALGHKPHGSGSIWSYGQPDSSGGPVVRLDRTGLSKGAQNFLDLIEPLDYRGWAVLSSAPVGDRDWPAREIIERMLDTPALSALIPIDIEGMLTDRNPGNLYLASPEPVGGHLRVESA